jgi:hypothetical protein
MLFDKRKLSGVNPESCFQEIKLSEQLIQKMRFLAQEIWRFFDLTRNRENGKVSKLNLCYRRTECFHKILQFFMKDLYTSR